MKITRQALQVIMRIVVSCCVDRNHYEYLIKLLADDSSSDFEIGKIQVHFPSVKFYDHLSAMARLTGKKVVDEEVVIQHFGGREHEKKVLAELHSPEACGMPKMFHNKNLFLHLLLPVSLEIGKRNKTIYGFYRNGKTMVVIEDLACFREDLDEISSGDMAIVHLASVIMIHPSKSVVRWLLSEQKKMPEFVKAAFSFHGKTIHQKENLAVTRHIMGRHGL